MNNIVIRKATIHDFFQIQQLDAGLFIHEAQKDPLINVNWPVEDAGETFLRRMITSPDAICIVAEIEKQLVGFLTGALLSGDRIRPITRAQLANIFVQESRRNQKVGTQLTEAFTEWCKQKQVQRIIVTAQAENKKGIAFYEHLGFYPHMLQLEKEMEQ